MGVLDILKRNKITQGLGMPVGGGLFFGKVAGFQPVVLLENGLLCSFNIVFIPGVQLV